MVLLRSAVTARGSTSSNRLQRCWLNQSWRPRSVSVARGPLPPQRTLMHCTWIRAGVPVGADGTGGAAESIVNQTAVDVLRRLPVSSLTTPCRAWAACSRS